MTSPQSIFRCVCLSLLIAATFPVTSHADFSHALDIYNEKRFIEARAAFEALAAIGDRTALFNLGVMHYRGEAVDRDPVRGYVLMRLANAGVDDEYFTDISGKLYGTFNKQEKQAAAELYEELSPIYDIQLIRKNILPKPLNDEDCPPQPVAIKKQAPEYPQASRRAGKMGQTVTEFTISPEGYVRDIYIESSTNREFSRASAKAATQFRYQPPENG